MEVRRLILFEVVVDFRCTAEKLVVSLLKVDVARGK